MRANWFLARFRQLHFCQTKVSGPAIKESEKCDAPALMRSAHSLKTSAGYFGGTRAFEAALKLEQMGHEGNLTQAGRALIELEAALEELKSALTGIMNEVKGSIQLNPADRDRQIISKTNLALPRPC
jgi:HPt (histidine-containing phosphotransfer) domain-containing protein